MMPSVRVLVVLVVVSMLGLPARAPAQSITESVAKMSPMDAQMISEGLALQGRYPRTRQRAASGRELAIRAAIFAAITGVTFGVVISRYCREEGSSCPGAAFKYGVYGAAIGAAVGVATGR
jgi:hypothetical protein